MELFDTAPPALCEQRLAAIAAEYFGIRAKITVLASERDQNARLKAEDRSYVLKIAHASEDPDQLRMQNATLAHLAAIGAPGVAQIVPTLAGESMARVDIDGRDHFVRVVTWLDGSPLSQTPRSVAQLRDLGAFMGDLTHNMQGFGHPCAFRPDFVWSLDHVSRLRPWAQDIADPGNRGRVAALFDRYAEKIAPRLAGLRASVLHQDANDNNVIVDAHNPDRVIGLIDFGDMAFGRTINELAITLAYAILDAEDLYAAIRAVIEELLPDLRRELTSDDALDDLVRTLARRACGTEIAFPAADDGV